MKKKCDHCECIIDFTKKDIKNNIKVERECQNTIKNCLRRGYNGSFFSKFNYTPIILIIDIYNNVENEYKYVICPCCGEEIFLYKKQLRILNTFEETETIYSDTGGTYTDY